jgi:hypothetical protein
MFGLPLSRIGSGRLRVTLPLIADSTGGNPTLMDNIEMVITAAEGVCRRRVTEAVHSLGRAGLFRRMNGRHLRSAVILHDCRSCRGGGRRRRLVVRESGGAEQVAGEQVAGFEQLQAEHRLPGGGG